MVLAQAKVWCTWLVPLCPGRLGAGLGLRYAPLLCDLDSRHVRRAQRRAAIFDGEVQASDKIDLLKAFNLQELANDLRRLHALQPSPELEGRIQWLVRRRDWALSQEWLQTAHSYNLEHMVACLMLGGFLRNMQNLKEVVKYAIRSGVPDVALQQHILGELEMPRSVPSATTLRRHRLTLFMATCLLEQEVHAEVIKDDFVRYATVDSSPQGPYDFVMSGARAISARSLLEAARGADRLHDASLDEDEKKEIGFLEVTLNLLQAAPAAVGSGR